MAAQIIEHSTDVKLGSIISFDSQSVMKSPIKNSYHHPRTNAATISRRNFTMPPAETSQATHDTEPKTSAQPSASQCQSTNGSTATHPSTPGPSSVQAAATPPANEEKLSNAELKKRAKAEKQAKRAQKKADEGVPPTQAGPSNPLRSAQQQQRQRAPPTPRETSIPSPSLATTRQQGKQTQSQTRPLPHRPAHSTPQSQQETQVVENKNVALFEHLYKQPRRTTIAGVSKDVYRDVLAVGLQMSNYKIRGSIVRCEETLLAFRKASQG